MGKNRHQGAGDALPAWKQHSRTIQMCKTNRCGRSASLTFEQVEQVCSNLPEKFSLLAEVMYASAGRVGECSCIRVRNLNFKAGLLTLEKATTKTKETRQVPLGASTLQKFKSWIKQHSLKSKDFIFFTQSKNTSNQTGEKAISTQAVDEAFRKCFEELGFEGCSTHSLRRSALTHLLEEGWNMREIMNISGHKDLASLQKYLDADRSETFKKYRALQEARII
jgi:integrase/recombinase XerD